MVIFLSLQIIIGNKTYQEVITVKPDLKIAIDEHLISKGREDLIVS